MTSPGDVDCLDPGSSGRWLIHSRSSTHVLDLDAHTYQRRAGPTGPAFAHDNTTVPYTRIEIWPRVGGRMLIWFDDPDTPRQLEHFRLPSRIRRISPDHRLPDRVRPER